jgi:hypothetical protein
MALAARLGEWPLLLKLVNGFLRERRQALPVAIAAASKRLDEKGFGRIEPTDYYLQLPYHLAEANERRKLDSLLLDPSWLAQDRQARRLQQQR